MSHSSTLPTDVSLAPGMMLGDFAIAATLRPAAPEMGVASFEVVGQLGSPVAGVAGTGRAIRLTAGQLSLAPGLAATMSQLTGIAHPTLVRVLAVGVVDNMVYTIESAASGERLSDRLRREGGLAPRLVAEILNQISAAIGHLTARNVTTLHLDSTAIWIDDKQNCVLGGYGLPLTTALNDPAQLAALTIELLAGRPIAMPLGVRIGVDQVRDRVNGLTETVGIVIAQGLNPIDSNQFPTAASFAAAFEQAVSRSASELVAGAYEAVERGDFQLGEILTKMIAKYDPNSRDLALLELKFKPANGAGALPTTPWTMAQTGPGFPAVMNAARPTQPLAPPPHPLAPPPHPLAPPPHPLAPQPHPLAPVAPPPNPLAAGPQSPLAYGPADARPDLLAPAVANPAFLPPPAAPQPFASPYQPAAAGQAAMPGYDDLDPEIVRMLQGTMIQPPAPAKSNAWVLFAVGFFVMVMVTVVIVGLVLGNR
jgi:hypothetical protein